MNPAIATWLFFRLARWGFWIWFLAYGMYFIWDRAPHMNSFNQLLLRTETIIFGTAIAAVFCGFFELMMRERAGIPRPTWRNLMPPATGDTTAKLPQR